MNKADFQRNFQNSFFGLILSQSTLEAMSANSGVTSAKYGISVGDIVPAGMPLVNSGGTLATCRLLLPLKGTDQIYSVKVHLPWREDIDEDPLYMRPGVPPTGMIQGRYSAWYMARRPARDTPRGFAPKHHAISLINKKLMRELGLENGDEWYQAYRVYNPVQYEWDVACRMIEDGDMLGLVVSRALSLGLDGDSRNTQIFYKGLGSIGFVEGRQPVLYESTATFPLREYVRKISGYTPDVR